LRYNLFENGLQTIYANDRDCPISLDLAHINKARRQIGSCCTYLL